MKKFVFALLTPVLLFSSTLHAPAQSKPDVAAPIRQLLDAFNTGDTKAEAAAYAQGDVIVVDDFAPYVWVGPHAGQDWHTGLNKFTAATGTVVKITYDEPTFIRMQGDLAYVVVPTGLNLERHGKPSHEIGQMTFVLHTEQGGWKIRSWTWTDAPRKGEPVAPKPQ